MNAYNDALIPCSLPGAAGSDVYAALFFISEDALATTLETEAGPVDIARAATSAIPVITPEMAARMRRL